MLKLNMKKIAKIFGYVVLAVVVLLFLLLIWTKRKIDNGEMVKWNGKWMTQEDFHKIVPPQVYKVESKNKPEEVYTAFRQALLDDDVEKALGLVRVEKRAKFAEVFKDKKMLENYKTLPVVEKIIKSEKDSYENISSFYYRENEKVYSVEFIKNKDGYWEIDQI
ncbi:hypothetical protein L6270_02985 [Candidatus Parcubacteria bacterium]|nr:hypothetical protein [Patescibacteria group bacterium]MBU4308926.1 hypothetical protein [Patescibacteria group bacterium]MBU4431816.1 hypothetical protein [Patescibacteria group bacterium]MBU4577286.1 hypothetical protein [Patescibacteria group bacterium]MCG2696976.1 hypothetical protein [Candidatus Parcubacteria bacterium]